MKRFIEVRTRNPYGRELETHLVHVDQIQSVSKNWGPTGHAELHLVKLGTVEVEETYLEVVEAIRKATEPDRGIPEDLWDDFRAVLKKLSRPSYGDPE